MALVQQTLIEHTIQQQLNHKFAELIEAELITRDEHSFIGDVSDCVYVWRGGSTINIHRPAFLEKENAGEFEAGKEVDCFTLYGDDKGGRPNAEQVREAVADKESELLAIILGQAKDFE